MVPVLLACWGSERYGGWLVLAAIPTYLTFSDFGFTYIAKNEMVMRSMSGNRDGVLAVFQSVFALLLATSSVLVIGLGIVLWWSPLVRFLTLGPIQESAAKSVLFALMLNVIASQFFLLFCSGIRTSGRPAAEVGWAATARLGEGLGTVASAVISTDLTLAAFATLVVRLIFIAAAWGWLRHIAPELRIGLNHARLGEIRRLFNPSASYMLVSLANALLIQGPVVILGLIGQPIDVVLFSTTRTLSRTGTAAANLVNFSFSPEYSRQFGSANFAAFRRLLNIHFAISVAGVAIYTIALLILGPWLIWAWTHGTVTLVHPFFELITAAVAAEMLWGAAFTPMAAINRHVTTSYVFFTLSVVGIVSCYYAATSLGINSVGAILLIVQGCMVGFTLWRAHHGWTPELLRTEA